MKHARVTDREERIFQQRYQEKRARDQARKQTRRQQMIARYAQQVATSKDRRRSGPRPEVNWGPAACQYGPAIAAAICYPS